jgi:hypothetical protein
MVVVVSGSVEPCRALFLQIQRKPELPVALVRLTNPVVFLRNSKVLAITVVRVGSAIASAHGVIVSGARLWLADARANADIILATTARRGFAKETAIAADAAVPPHGCPTPAASPCRVSAKIKTATAATPLIVANPSPPRGARQQASVRRLLAHDVQVVGPERVRPLRARDRCVALDAQAFLVGCERARSPAPSGASPSLSRQTLTRR